VIQVGAVLRVTAPFGVVRLPPRELMAVLELRPNCECCDKDLPPEAPDALICSFECTFCSACAAERLGGRCPNCGGELLRRPVRPLAMLARYPASRRRIVKPHVGCGAAGDARP